MNISQENMNKQLDKIRKSMQVMEIELTKLEILEKNNLN